MAWDMFFDNTWTQRINTEERSFIDAQIASGAPITEEQQAKALRRLERQERKERERTSGGRSSGSHRSTSTGSLSAAGSRALAPKSPSESRTLSAAALGRTTSLPEMLKEVPDQHKALLRFPVSDKDLMTARVEPHEEGKVPQIKMKKGRVKALWVPGEQSYINYTPEFSFVDPPAWTPEDILRPRRK
mmetsp:Transcript_67143/g.143672  ORF Transcript_67143/g.143672 Transcript_67143/m.143672 type:complete len:188 (-) Transcript_67143:208-771(-)